MAGSRFLLNGEAERADRLGERLEQLGAERVVVGSQEMILASVQGNLRASVAKLVAADPGRRDLPDGEVSVDVDTVVVEGTRSPSLGLARGLGCETDFDPTLKCDRARLLSEVATTIPGVFLAGDALLPGNEEDARRSGRLAGTAAARWAQSNA